VPEKQSKGFGQSENKQLFTLKAEESKEPMLDKQIQLNIADARVGKILLRQKLGYNHLTGNPIIDFYGRINGYFVDHTKIKIKDKATVFRLLAVMINAGLSIIKSLKTLASQNEKIPRLSKTLLQMADAIEGGKSLSGAMEQYPEIFSEAEIGMVHAGEASGQLNKTLRDLAEDVEKSASLMGKIKGALVYPIAIMGLVVVVVFVMMIVVVPQLSKLFSQTGHDLPLPTQVLMGISNFSVNFWPLILLIASISFVAITAWKKTKSGKYFWDLMLLKLPIFGNVIQKGTLAKFARSFGNLLGSGVPIIKSLEIVGNAIGNEVYKERLFLTAEDMKRGIPMAENMAESKLFPSMLVNMIEIGEQTAQLENVTKKVAEFYDEEVDNVVNALTKVMEPMIMVIVGVVVGGIVAAIMLPIIQLTNITGGFS
jgi:type IV pilus assembly protein PilC